MKRSIAQRLRTHPATAYGVLVTILGATYLHLGTYAFEDDYHQIVLALWDPVSWWYNNMTAEGRPLYGVLLLAGWKLLQTVENAIWFRVFGLAGVILTACIFFRFATKQVALSRFHAVLASLVVLLTPGMAVYTFWATTAPFAWSAAIAVYAGWLTFEASAQRAWRMRRLSVASILLLMAEMIYQPSAGFFLLPPFLVVAVRGDRAALRRGIFVLLHFAAILVVYFIAYKIASLTLFPNSERTARGGDVTLISENFHYFAFTLTPFIASSWAAFWAGVWTPLVQWGMLGAVLAWAFVRSRQNGITNALSGLAFLAATFIAAGAPLIASGTYAPYRTLSVPLAMLTLLGATGLFRLLPRRLSLRGWIPALAVLLLAIITRHVVTRMVVDPQREEYDQVSHFLRENLIEIPTSITAVQPRAPWKWWDGKWPIHEYGNYSAHRNWVLSNLLRVLIAERFSLEPTPYITAYYPELMVIDVIEADAPGPWYHGQLVDFRRILGQPSNDLHPDSHAPTRAVSFENLGVVQLAPTGWARHPQMGWMKLGPAQWIRHEQVGWLRILGREDNIVFLYNQDFGSVSGDLRNWPKMMSRPVGHPVNLLEQSPLRRIEDYAQ